MKRNVLIFLFAVSFLLFSLPVFSATPSATPNPTPLQYSEEGFKAYRGMSPEYIYSARGLSAERTRLLYWLILVSSVAGITLLVEVFKKK